jgi:tripartite-type tricarboxylate transporter receptor subunit TctC
MPERHARVEPQRGTLVKPQRRALLAAAAVLLTSPAQAANLAPPPAWKQLRLTVAYPPGGVSDETARELGRQLSKRLAVTVVVDNRAGAGGAVAMQELARARADGSVLCFSAIAPLLDATEAGTGRSKASPEVAAVAAVMSTPVLVVATPAFAGQRFDDVIVAARRGPGQLRWASSGHATTGFRVLEQIRIAAGVDITHVPYAGGGQQINDALAGHFELLSTNVAGRQLRYVQDGRLRALAVGAPQRLAVLPDVPTLTELGHPAANLSSLFGVFAPAATPAARLDQLNTDINAVLDEPAFRQQLETNGNLPVVLSRSAFASRIASEAAAWRRLAQDPAERQR